MWHVTNTRYLRAVGATLLFVASLFATQLYAQSSEVQRLAPSGELRVAFIMSNSALVKRTPEGQYSGVFVDIANALAAKLGVPIHPVPYDNIQHYNRSIGKDEWDVALSPRDLSRIERLGFSEPFLAIENSYVVRSGSSLLSADEVDRTGIKVAVAEHSPADGFLSRTLKKAKIVRLPTGTDQARQALTFGSVDVYAGNTDSAYLIAAQVPGATVLVGQFNSVPITFAVPKSKAAALSFLNDYIHEAKHDSVIADAVKHSSLRGVRALR